MPGDAVAFQKSCSDAGNHRVTYTMERKPDKGNIKRAALPDS